MRSYSLFASKQQIHTNHAGIISLLNYYHYAKQFQNCWVSLNFDGINFIDANLSAFLFGIIYYLRKTRDVKTFIDFQSLKYDLHVLQRNGLTNYISGKENYFKPTDFRDTTIPLSKFSQHSIDAYCDYIEKDFLHQRGLKKIKFDDKQRIIASYLEIFENVGLHANTTHPIFVCGQYFPNQCELKFTLVDLGDGFLKKIAEQTKISKSSEAIAWALKGNSTKIGAKGGSGLKNIFWYCYKNGGSLNIVSDDCYFHTSGSSTFNYKLPQPFVGATIHLVIRYLN